MAKFDDDNFERLVPYFIFGDSAVIRPLPEKNVEQIKAKTLYELLLKYNENFCEKLKE